MQERGRRLVVVLVVAAVDRERVGDVVDAAERRALRLRRFHLLLVVSSEVLLVLGGGLEVGLEAREEAQNLFARHELRVEKLRVAAEQVVGDFVEVELVREVGEVDLLDEGGLLVGAHVVLNPHLRGVVL